MNASRALRASSTLIVVLYLCVAGWFFVLAPWSRFWGVVVVPRVPLAFIPLLDSPALRGALSGFGALHFIAAFSWLAEGTSSSSRSPSPTRARRSVAPPSS